MAKQISLPKEYPVPANWCWIDMGNLVRMKSGFPFDSKRFSSESEGRMPLIRIRDVLKGETVTFTDEECSKEYIIHEGEILIGMDGDFNIAKWKSKDALLNQRVCSIESKSELLLDDYLYYYLPSPLKKINEATPSVTVKHLSTKTLTQIPIPLPPLAEQQRIVDRIESLFAKLDEAKEKTQTVVDRFELRKSAILYKAFVGELTELWRKEHGGSDLDWYITKFDNVAEIKSNLVDPADYQDFPHIAPDNIEKRTGNLLEYHTIAEDGVKSGKHLFYAGQILYSKIRPYLSKVVIAYFNGLCSADMYPISAKEDTKYLWYYMLSDEFLEQASSAGSRSVLPKINQKELSKIIVRMTTLKEQQAIAKFLDDIFAKEHQAIEAAEAVLSQIDAMKKVILVRAFRGELGTNDPAEEWAGELVKKLLGEET